MALLRALLLAPVCFLVVACSDGERPGLIEPDRDERRLFTLQPGEMTSADSAAYLAARDTMTLSQLAGAAAVITLREGDGFVVTFADRECAAQGNVMSLTDPVEVQLTSNGCVTPAPGTRWTYPGPYPEGTLVQFRFFSGYINRPGRLRITGSYPLWTVAAEDGFDGDFNDLVFTVEAVQDTVVRITEIRSLRAQGPANSFTSDGGDAKIMVTAEVRPASLVDEVRWEVEDAEGGADSRPPAPGSLNTGGVLIWTVPPQDAGRWKAFASHPGALERKSLGFEVTAYVEANGKRYESEPVEIEQDEIDTVRQEYIDLAAAPVPGYAEFQAVASAFPGLNSGDYGYAVLKTRMLIEQGRLREAFFAKYPAYRGRWQINTIYRNLVHQRQHISRSANPAKTSAHNWGCGVDLQTFPVPRTTPADSTAALDYWNRLDRVARRLGWKVEPRRQSGVGHVHINPPDWTKTCHSGWQSGR